MNNSRIPPKFKALAEEYAVNLKDVAEALYQPQYDTLIYDGAAGQTELRFFQQPKGQNGKTLEDTNMTVAGTIPAPQQFLVTQICLDFIGAGSVSDASSAAENAADLQTFLESGVLSFNVGSKNQITDAPLGLFPPTHHIEINGGGTVTNGAVGAWNTGLMYNITPLTIPFSQNFDVTLGWSTALPLPSGNDARVVCHLNGYLYRSVQ